MAYIVAEHALYVAVEVSDDSIVLDGPGVARWDGQDGCEIFVNAAHARRIAGRPVCPLPAGTRARLSDHREPPAQAVKVAVALRQMSFMSGGSALGSELVDGRVIGFDISVADKDKDGSFSWLAWGAGTQKFDMPDRCGELILVRPETELGEVSGTIAWKDASEASLPPRSPGFSRPAHAALARGDRRSVGDLQGHKTSSGLLLDSRRRFIRNPR